MKTLDFSSLKSTKISNDTVEAKATYKVDGNDETYSFQYRYADGNTLLRAGDLSNTEFIFLVLSKCLINPATELLAGAEGVRDLMRVMPGLANAIAAEIANASTEYLNGIEKAKEDSVKNSNKTGSNEHSTATAGNTASSRESQKTA